MFRKKEKVTKAQYEQLKRVVDRFGDNLIEQNYDGDKEKALADFQKNLSIKEFSTIVLHVISRQFNNKSSYSKSAKNLIGQCEASFSGLQKQFGEAAMAKALPEEARNRDMAEFLEKMGAPKIASLINKTL